MAATPDECIAALRLLVAIAKADSTIHERERSMLQSALSELDLGGLSPEQLLDEDIDLEKTLAGLTASSLDFRASAYTSAVALACADGSYDPAESALLETIRKGLHLGDEHREIVARLFGSGASAAPAESSTIPKPTLSPVQRDAAIKSDTRKAAIVAAVLGAFPVPAIAIVTDLAVVALQVSLARDIAAAWGRSLDRASARSLLLGFGAATGARMAVTSLVKVIPGWGSAFGAAASYTSTIAVGETTSHWCESGAEEPGEALREAFAEYRRAGKDQYEADRQKVEQLRETQSGILRDLSAQVGSGEVDVETFGKNVSAAVGPTVA